MRVVILGAGGHGRVVAECARLAGSVEPVGFLDDHPEKLDHAKLGLPVLGGLDRLAERSLGFDAVLLGIGDNRLRLALAERARRARTDAPILIHPLGHVSASATCGAGTVVMAGGILQTGASVGEAVVINTGATVDHDCRLGDGVHVAPGAHLAGGVEVGARTMIGIGATVIEGIRIGADCLIGAGAVVIGDLADGARVAGVPARPMPQRGQP